jgi:hypothetical protein
MTFCERCLKRKKINYLDNTSDKLCEGCRKSLETIRLCKNCGIENPCSITFNGNNNVCENCETNIIRASLYLEIYNYHFWLCDKKNCKQCHDIRILANNPNDKLRNDNYLEEMLFNHLCLTVIKS